jgi:hypothetical protein
MAGEWIKMRIDLQSHPKIVRILSATGTDKFRVVGGLHAVWGVFDIHSEDGILRGYTPELLDHVIGWPGLARAMEAVGWLLYDGLETLSLPEFSEHNGQSAKRRAEDQKRKREGRKSVRILSANSPPESGLEKRREEKNKERAISSVSTDRIPYADIVDAYHAALPMLPQVRKLTKARKDKLRKCWLEDEERQTLAYWTDFFGFVAKSDFLTGRNGRFTACDFEWLVEPGRHLKVSEGKYDNRETA